MAAQPEPLHPLHPPDTAPEAIRLAGNSPLPLDSATDVWLVESGMVEVFAVPRGDFGPRTHLATVMPGGLLCGIDPDDGTGHGLGLLAVGTSGTRLLRQPVLRVWDRGHDPDAEDLAGRIDAWLDGLCGGLARPAPPRSFEELRPGVETHLAEAGRPVRSREGVAWVRHLQGRTSLLGDERLALDIESTAGGLFPVPEPLWLTASGEARLLSLSTAEAVRDGGLWAGLARFHHLLLAAVALQRAKGETLERERLGRKQDLDRAALREAYGRLTSILQGGVVEGAELGKKTDHLLATCRLVGAVQGIAMRDHPEGQPVGKQGDKLAQICA
ncbi:MAG TPA: hypothetical protein VGK45_02375, partial [Thermoanaerobaculia bacterium]